MLNFPSYASIIASAHLHLNKVLSDPEYSDFIRSTRKIRVEPCGHRDARVVMVLDSEEAAAEFAPIRGNVFPVGDYSFAHFSFDIELEQSAK